MSKIKELINKKEQNCFRFHPEKVFYKAVNIGQKRWGKLYRNEASPTLDELKAIAEYFEIEVTELL